MQGYAGMSCSRCQKGWYRFQRKCVKCEDGTEAGLYVAYFFLLVAFYIVKKLSTIVLPSMYIILTYIQCLSIVGNRQGWGTKRTKAVLKSTEIARFLPRLVYSIVQRGNPFRVQSSVFHFHPHILRARGRLCDGPIHCASLAEDRQCSCPHFVVDHPIEALSSFSRGSQ